MRRGSPLYRCADTALLRGNVYGDLALPDWPDLPVDSSAGGAAWLVWLRKVWELTEVAAAVEQASPDLAHEVDAVCAAGEADVRRIRRTALSVARYVLRMTGRATPAGLFAGISLASFGQDSETRWGTDHQAVARADASWVTSVIKELESCPELLARLTLIVNTAGFERGDRLVLPSPAEAG